MPSLRPLHVSLLVVLAVFGWCFYRAATQSFTTVESRTFLAYTEAPLPQALRDTSAGDHGLYPLLMRSSRRLLGRSELVQRLPTLIACVLFLTAVWVICTRALGAASWLHPLGVAAMTLQPPVLDAFAAARGEGLALAFTAWTLYMMWAGRPRLSALGAGLALASSLAFALAIAAVSCVVSVLYLRRGRLSEFIDEFAGPMLVIAFVFLAIPVANGWRAAPSILALWPVIGFVLLIAADRIPSRVVALPLLLAALGLVGVHLAGVRLTHFDGAARESGMKHLMRRLAEDSRGTPAVALQTPAGLEDCARYYGIRYRIGGLTVVNDDTPARYAIVAGSPESGDEHVLERHGFSGTSLLRRTELP